jgi:hypothetical protein
MDQIVALGDQLGLSKSRLFELVLDVKLDLDPGAKLPPEFLDYYLRLDPDDQEYLLVHTQLLVFRREQEGTQAPRQSGRRATGRASGAAGLRTSR